MKSISVGKNLASPLRIPRKKNCFLVNTKYLELVREEFCETEEYLREAVERAWEDDWQSTLEVFNAVNFGAEISQNAGLAMQFYHLTYKMGDKFYPHALLSTIMTEQKNKPE
jgi:hypothetical protein